MKKHFIPALNFHLWEPCNMRCKFCFATFQDVKQSILPKGHLPKEQAIELVRQIADFGINKITFAGGEPTLCPWLGELMTTAHQAGMTTMIVTNGSKLSEKWLQEHQDVLDWIALSVDSLDANTNLVTGRAISGNKPFGIEDYSKIIQQIQQTRIRLKINTVVTAMNYKEDMSQFILDAKPERWKIFQVLPIVGQNDQYINELTLSDNHFQSFVQQHQDKIGTAIPIVPENNDLMTASYLMIDPAGRFFDNSTGTYIYSPSILEIGMEQALKFNQTSADKFFDRGGFYDWN